MLRPGALFAGYRIEHKLGAGAMGSVYLARHPRLPRMDALKILTATASDPGYRMRFIREAELAAHLDHPNIVAVYDRGVEGDSLWIAMQYVAGPDAAELIDRAGGGLPPAQAVEILTAAAAGLDEAHRHGLVHRDVKPANILISRADGRVLVTDFGIARAANDSDRLTDAGSVLATLAYAAPEQIEGTAIDYRADIYALGASLHHMLTGTTPFPRPTAAAVMYAQLTEPPPRPSTANPALPAQFDHVIATAMAKRPDERYASCADLAAAAYAAAHGVGPTGPPRRSRARRIAIAVAAMIALVTAVAAGVVAARSSRTGSAATATAPTTVSSVTTPPAPAGPWGTYQYVIDAFPDLLPKTPTERGYRGLRCNPTNGRGNPVALSVRTSLARIECSGDNDPLEGLRVICNADRSARNISPNVGDIVERDEEWTRGAANGHLVAQHSPAGTPGSIGNLSIVVHDKRSFCQIDVAGGSSGQDLIDRWWNSAPI